MQQRHLSTASRVLSIIKMTLSAILILILAFMGLHAICMYTQLFLSSLTPNLTFLYLGETAVIKIAAYSSVTFVACLGLLLTLIITPVIVSNSAIVIQYQIQLIRKVPQVLAALKSRMTELYHPNCVDLASPGRKTSKATGKQLARSREPTLTRCACYLIIISFISSVIRLLFLSYIIFSVALCIASLLQEPASYKYTLIKTLSPAVTSHIQSNPSWGIYSEKVGFLLAFWGLSNVLRYGLRILHVGVCGAYSGYIAPTPRKLKQTRSGQEVISRMHTTGLGAQYPSAVTIKVETLESEEGVAIQNPNASNDQKKIQEPPPVQSDSGYGNGGSSPIENETTQSEDTEPRKKQASQSTPKSNSKRLINTDAGKRLCESLAKDQKNMVNIEAKMLNIEQHAARIREMLHAHKSSSPKKEISEECSTDLEKVVPKPKIRSRYKLEVSTSHRPKAVQFDLNANITYNFVPEGALYGGFRE